MNNPNYLHLIGLLIIVGFSVISWIYRKLKEEAQKKKLKDMIEERQREMLRTGRDPMAAEAPQSAEAQRQREIQQRREAQLAELRRRALARQQGAEVRNAPTAPPTMSPPPMTSIPGSAGPTVPQRRAPMGPPLQRPQPKPMARQGPQRQPPQRASRPQRQQKQQQRQPSRPVEPEPTTHRLVMEETIVTPRRTPVVSAAAPQTPEEWRRAIIANEILSPPLAVRTQEVPVPF